jgi:choline transport protein
MQFNCEILSDMPFQFWSFWPQATPTTAEDFNWASVIFGGVIILATIYYVLKGRKTYHGPVVLVKKM